MKNLFRERGFTLVEMLVVVAIVSIIAAVSIPVAAKYSSLGRSDVQRTALALQEVIRAAKIYATTNNVNTAVAYSLGAYDTSYGDGNRRVITGAAVVRALSRDELRNITVAEGLYGSGSYYTQVQDIDGAFQRFEGDTCMAFWREDAPMDFDGVTINRRTLIDIAAAGYIDDVEDDMGLRSIYILDTYVDEGTQQLTGEYVLAPTSPDGLSLGYPENENSFAAHVFKSSGSLSSLSDKQRFKLYVTPLPNALVEDLFVRQVTVGSGVPRAETLDLFATLGRIRLN